MKDFISFLVPSVSFTEFVESFSFPIRYDGERRIENARNLKSNFLNFLAYLWLLKFGANVSNKINYKKAFEQKLRGIFKNFFIVVF